MKRVLVLLLAASASCECLPPTNPFDPDTPSELQAKASLLGRVELVNGFDVETRTAELAVLRVGLLDASGARVTEDGQPAAHPLSDVDPGDGLDRGAGAFAFEGLVPGVYSVVVEGVPSFYAQPQLPAVTLAPGDALDLGALVFSLVGEGPGAILGEVRLGDGAGGQRTVSIFSRRGSSVDLVKSVVTDGAFDVRGLDAGTYAVVAEADGFVPSYRLDVKLEGSNVEARFDGAQAITLQPVSGAVLPVLGEGVIFDDDTFYVRGDAVPLAILQGTAAVDVGVTAMRVATNADFLDDAGAPLPFSPFSAAITQPLPPREGRIGVFVQLEATSASGFSFTSPVISTSVLRDVSAPRVVEATLPGLGRDAQGTALSPTQALVVRCDAIDEVSAVDGLGIGLGAAPPAAFEDVTAPPGLVRFERPQNAAVDGETSAWCVVEDKAGNRSDAVELPVIVDTTAPDVSLLVDNAPGGLLGSRVAHLSFDETGAATDLPVAMQVRVVGDAFGELLPWGPADVVVGAARGGPGDEITLEARVFDRVGNEATLSRAVTLDLAGTVTGVVAAEGVPLLTPSPAGAVVRVVDSAGAEVGSDVVDADGAFAVAGVPEGAGYTLEVILDGYRTARRTGLSMPTPPDGGAAILDLGLVDVALARGNLAGSAVLGDVPGSAGHGGITLSLTLTGPGGRVFADVTQTDDAGEYLFIDVPVTRAGEAVRIAASRDDYALAVVDAIVAPDVIGDVAPIVLTRNRGDFDVCAPSGPCEPVQFVNTDAVRVELRDPTDVVRLHVSVAGAPAVAIDLSADNATPVSIAGLPDGTVDIVVQTEKADGSRADPLAASVVLDTQPPANASVERVASAAARDPRFTRNAFVDVTLSADVGSGVVAPLALPRFQIADTAPAGLPPEIAGCVQVDAPCRLPLPGAAVDDVEEKLHRVFAVSCDAAGNCADPVASFVIHDRTPPARGNGADFLVAATGSIVDGSGATPVVVLPSPFYAGELHLGRARTAGAVNVVDETGTGVADVFAFRFSLAAATLPRANIQGFSDPPVADAVRSGADVVVPALLPGGTVQTVFAELIDAAGNAAGGFEVAVRIDDTPPGLVFVVNSGAPTREASVPFSVTVPTGAETPSRVDISVDGGASSTFALPLTGAERVALPAVDGSHLVRATAFDAVGNSTSSEVAIVLDRQGPRVDAVRCTSATCVDTGVGTIVSNAADAKVDLSVVAADALLSVTQASVSVGGAPAVLFPIDAVVGVQLPTNAATTVSVAAVDAVGNEGAPFVRSVIHDALAPAVTSLVLAAGATSTSSVQVPVHVEADADVVEMRFSSSATFAGAFAPFRADDFFTLAGADGSKQVCVQVKDGAGNLGSRCQGITLDRAAPTGDVQLVGAATTRSLTVGVSLSYPADTTAVAVAGSALACESEATTPYIPATGSPQLADVVLSAGDGVRTLFACFTDGAGNVAADQVNVTVDQTAPVVAAVLDGGAPFSLDTSVGLGLTASADTARMAVAIDTSLDCATTALVAFAPSSTITLPAVDGAHTVLVCVEDAVGNRSASPVSASIFVDRTDPTGSIIIEGGAAFTRSLNVNLALTRATDVTQMAIAPVADLACATADFVAFNPAAVVALPGPDGTQTVSVCLKDAAGRSARFTDTVVLDRQAPNGTIVVAGGADTTPARDVNVTLTFDGDTTGLAVSAFPLSCETAIFGAPATTAQVSLPFIGQNTVTACLQDGAGNIRAITDTIFLEDNAGDALAIAIDGGAAAARSRNVSVSLFRPSSDFTQMKVVEAATIDCADLTGYEAFNSTKALALSAGTAPAEGTRTVFACVRNPLSGVTKAASDSIFLDTFAPNGSIVLNAGGAVTRNATVTATLTNAFAGAGEVVTVALAEASTLVGGQCSGSFEAFSAAKSFTLSGGDGSRSVFLCLRDAAGNTAEVSDTIGLDRAAPSPVTVSVPAAVTSTSVSAALTFPADAAEIVVAASALDCSTATGYLPASSPRTVLLAAVEGVQSVVACFRDAAGNTSQASATTTLDLADPTGVVTVAGGAAFTTSTSVTLTIQAAADVAKMALVEGTTVDCATATYVAFAAQPNFTLSSADGTKTVQVCLEDRAGRRAAAVPDTIVLDRSAPNGSVVVADGAAAVRDRNVVLTLGTGGAVDVVSYAVAEGAITCNAANLSYVPFAAVVPFTLSSGDGTKSIQTCLKDAAGNVSTLAGSDSVVLDTAGPALPGNAVVVQDGDGFLQAETTVSVALSWTTAGDAASAKVAEGAIDCQSPAGYQDLPAAATTTTLLNLPVAAGEGGKVFAACFRDAAGNVSTAQDTTVRDNTAPVVTSVVCADCTSNGTTTFTTDSSVQLAVTSDEAGAGLASARVAIDGGVDVSTTLQNGVVTVAGLVAGARTIRVKLVDRAGNVSSDAQARTIALTFDNAPPALASLSLNGGAAATNSRVVTVSATLAAGSGDTVAMAVAEADGSASAISSCATATYAPFVATFTRTLPANDGTKAVSLCLKDAAGNLSTAPTTATITLDGLPPSLPANAVEVQDGDGFLQGEATASIVLRWNVAGDAREAKVGEGVVDCGSSTGYVALPAAATTTTLASVAVSAGDGTKNIAACFRDAGQNTVTAQDLTTRDGTAPVVTSAACVDCTVDGATVFSTDGSISIATTSDESGSGVASALVSVDGGADVPATVTSGVVAVGGLAQGSRSVRLRLVDRAGNVSSVAQGKTLALTVDTTAPSLVANTDFRLNGANSGGATNDPAVRVTITSPPVDAVQMALAEAASLTCSTASYLPIATTTTFVVSSSQGAKTLKLCLKDRAGNTTAVAHTASITLDTVAPSLPAVGAVAIEDGGDGLLTTVTGGVSVRLNWNTIGDVAAFKLGESAVDCSFEPYERPAGIATVNTFLRTAFALSSVDGSKLVVACFKDAAGNVVTAQDTTVLDQAGPNGSLSVNEGAAFTTDDTENVTVTLRASPDVARAALVETNNSACTVPTLDCATASYQALSGALVDGVLVSTSTENLSGAPASEGAKCFEACFEDAAGNRTATAVLDGITFDKSAPSVAAASVTVTGLDKNGASQVRTRTPFVTVTVSGQPADTAEMRVSEDGSFAGGTQPFVPFSTTAQQLTLSVGDATKNVFVQLKDLAGNVGAATQKSILLDTTPPAGTAVVLAAGASVTRNPSVTATLQATGATEMKLVTPDNGADTEAFTAFVSSTSVTIEDNAAQDGPKTVLVVFRDDAGNESGAASDGIDLDRAAPTADTLPCGAGTSTGVCVNGGAAATNSVSAQLALAATGATEVQIAVDGCADTESFVPFTTATSALLPSTDGAKTVAVRFRDAAGNADQTFASCATTPGRTDTILLDTAAPNPALSVALASAQAGDSAGFTTTGNVRVTFAFSPGAGEETQVKHGEGAVDCSTSAGYVALPAVSPLVLGDNTPVGDAPVALSSGDGTKTYVACFKDDAGNVTSTTGAIVVDAAAPTGTIAVNAGATLTNSTTVSVSLTFSNDVDGVAFVRDTAPTCNGALTYQAPSPTMSTTISSGDGTRQLFACFRDEAGNFSTTPASDSITLDSAAPAVTVDARRTGTAAPGDGGAGGARFTNTREVIVSVASLSADATEIALVSGAPTAPCATASFLPVPQAAPFNLGFTLDDADTLHTIGVCARDAAGNVGTTTRQITLDRAAPQATVSINAGAASTNSTSVTAALVVTPSGDLLRRVTGADPLVDCSLAAYSGAFAAQPGSFAQTVAAPDGQKFAVACLQDQAGNVTRVQDDIALDQTVPEGVLALDNGATFTLDLSVTADFTGVSSDVTLLKLSTTTIDCSVAAGYVSFVSGTTVNLAAGDGTKTVLACLKDAAGNTTELSDRISLDQTNPAVSFSLERRGTASPVATFTNSRDLTVKITALAADATALAMANTSIDCGTASYEALPSPLPVVSLANPLLKDFALAAGTDGSRTVALCVKDSAGRTNGTTGSSASITLDTVAPAVTLAIDGGAAITGSSSVTVSQGSSPAADPLRASTAGFSTSLATDCARASFSGSFGTLAATAAGALADSVGTDDSGTKFLVGCYQDQAGNVASGVDDIVFDEDRPNFAARPVCSGCNIVPATPSVATKQDAFLGFTNEASLVEFDPNIASADAELVLAMVTLDDVDTEPDGFATTGSGIGEDRLCTSDAECNAVAGEACVGFPVVDNGTAGPTVANRCAVTSLTDAVFAPLLPADGKATVVLALVDSAGNFSNAREIFVVKDTVPATVSFQLSSGAFTSQQTTAVRDLAIIGETHFQTTGRMGTYVASSLPTFADAQQLAYEDTTSPFSLTDAIPVTLSAGDGTKTVRVLFTDNAGNVSTVATQDTLLDTTAPSQPRFANASTLINASGSVSFPALAAQSTDDGAGLLTSRPYLLRGFSSTSGAPAALSCVLTGGGVACNWDGTSAFSAPASMFSEGENRISIVSADRAGNVSDADLVIITKDSVAPAAPVLVATSGEDFVNLSWTPGDNTHSGFEVFYVRNAVGSCSSSALAYTGEFAFEGPSPISAGNVTAFSLTGMPPADNMCFAVAAVDAAGNRSVLDVEGLFILPVSFRKVADITAAQLGLAAGASPNGVGAMAERNGLLYVAAAGKGLMELSVANPACFGLAAAQFASCTGLVTGATTHTSPRDIALAGGFAFVADTTGVGVLRIQEGQAPVQLFNLPLTDVRGVDVEGPVLAASHDGGVTFYNLTPLYAATPVIPTTTSTFARTGADGLDVDIQDNLVAMAYGPEAASPSSPSLIDITNLASPVLAARQCEVSAASSVALVGRAYVFRNHDAAYVCDLSSPLSFRPVESALPMPAFVARLVPYGPYVFGVSSNDVVALDMSNRAGAKLAGRKAMITGGATTTFNRGALALYGNRIFASPFVTNGTPNIEVFEMGGSGAAFDFKGSDGALIADRGLVQFDDAIMNGGKGLYHMGESDVELDLPAELTTANFIHPAEENGAVVLFSHPAAGAGTGFDAHLRNEAGLTAPVINDGATGLKSQNTILRWPFLLYVVQNGTAVELRSHRLDTNVATGTLSLGTGTLAVGGRANLALYNNSAYVVVPGTGIRRVTVNMQTGALSAATTIESDAGVQGVAPSGRWLFFWTTTGGNVLKAGPLAANGSWSSVNVVTVDASAGATNGNFIAPPTFYGPLMLLPSAGGAGILVNELTYNATSPFAPADSTTLFQPSGQSGRAAWITGDRLYMAREGRAIEVYKIR